jgi:hypothetical protein
MSLNLSQEPTPHEAIKDIGRAVQPAEQGEEVDPDVSLIKQLNTEGQHRMLTACMKVQALL